MYEMTIFIHYVLNPVAYVLITSELPRLRSLYRLFSFSGGTTLRGVQGNPNYFPILVQGDAVHGIWTN